MSEVNIEGVNSEVRESILRIDDLHKNFIVNSRGKKITNFALRGVSISIKSGESVGIVGESGCGKSTLARLLVGLEEPTRGVLQYKESSLQFNKSTRKQISMVFQDPYASLDPRMSISSCIREPMGLLSKNELLEYVRDLSSKYRDELKDTEPEDSAMSILKIEGKRKELENLYAKLLLREVGLNEQMLIRYPNELSGGQRQRVAIARAISVRPELLVLDEPVSALDVSVQAGIISLLKELQNDHGLTMLFISHDLRIVKNVCSRVVVMYLGQIMEDGVSEDIFSVPRHPYTKALLKSIPEITFKEDFDFESEETDKSEKALFVGEVPSPANPPQGCPFRTRCERATDACAVSPPLAQLTDGRLIACHFPY